MVFAAQEPFYEAAAFSLFFDFPDLHFQFVKTLPFRDSGTVDFPEEVGRKDQPESEKAQQQGPEPFFSVGVQCFLITYKAQIQLFIFEFVDDLVRYLLYPLCSLNSGFCVIHEERGQSRRLLAGRSSIDKSALR